MVGPSCGGADGAGATGSTFEYSVSRLVEGQKLGLDLVFSAQQVSGLYVHGVKEGGLVAETNRSLPAHVRLQRDDRLLAVNETRLDGIDSTMPEWPVRAEAAAQALSFSLQVTMQVRRPTSEASLAAGASPPRVCMEAPREAAAAARAPGPPDPWAQGRDPWSQSGGAQAPAHPGAHAAAPAAAHAVPRPAAHAPAPPAPAAHASAPPPAEAAHAAALAAGEAGAWAGQQRPAPPDAAAAPPAAAAPERAAAAGGEGAAAAGPCSGGGSAAAPRYAVSTEELNGGGLFVVRSPYDRALETNEGAGYMSVREGDVVYVCEGTFEQGQGESGVNFYEHYVFAQRQAQAGSGQPEHGWVAVPPLLYESEGD